MNPKQLHKILLDKAVQLLAQRNHSSHELKQKLTLFCSKINAQLVDLSSQEIAYQIDLIITHCIAKHWLDDILYINQYIDMRVRKGYGKKRILLELEQRGLTNSVLNQSLIENKDIEWIELGFKQLQKKFKLIDKSDIKMKAKIYHFLAYRGFTHSDIQSIYTLAIK